MKEISTNYLVDWCVIINITYIITFLLTYFLILLPFIVYGVGICINNKKEQNNSLLIICFFFPCFFIVSYSLFKRHSIFSTVKSISNSLNIKFILTSFIIGCLIILIHILLRKFFKIYSNIFEINYKKTPKIIFSFLAFFLCINISYSIKAVYGIVSIDQILFHLSFANTGANYSILIDVLINTVFLTVVHIILFIICISLKINLSIKIISWLKDAITKYINIIATIIPVVGFVYLLFTIGLPQYIFPNRNTSLFYEEKYIFPNQVNITFPNKKRNLIVIFVEGLETGLLTFEKGGAFTENMMPEIVALAENNVNFSHNDNIGGAVQLYGTEWTIAGIAGYYSGLPLSIRFLDLTGCNSYGTIGNKFLPGAYNIGDILYNAGYKNYFFLGSDIAFGGRDKYFETHGNTIIFDYNYFYDNNYIPENYRVWWGIEDRKLYEFTKAKILEIKKDEPFFITLLTADTHPKDGFLDDHADVYFDSQIKNVIRDMSKQLHDFVCWLKQQEFYENTTIVILGDHLYQDSSFFPEHFQIQKLSSRYEERFFRNEIPENYNRYPINIFINSLLDINNTKNRTFSHFDFFPTILESIGVEFDSEGLALGRSLNKGKTLLEKYGEAEVNRQLRTRSELYNSLWR